MARRRIVIEVEVPDGSDVESSDEAEDAAFAVAQQAYGQVLRQMVDEREQTLSARSPECGGQQVVRKGRGGRKLYTRMGAVRLKQQRCRCSECGRAFLLCRRGGACPSGAC